MNLAAAFLRGGGFLGAAALLAACGGLAAITSCDRSVPGPEWMKGAPSQARIAVSTRVGWFLDHKEFQTLIGQEAMFDMRELYAADGLAVPDWRLRPDDHLVFQLQFVAKRLERLATLTEAENAHLANDHWRSLATLLDHHLLRWLPDFSSRVSVRCDTEFYAALFLLTHVWCEQLRDLIALHLGESRPSKEEVDATLRPKHLDEVKAVPVQFMPGIGGPSW
jgi:hypothetical protein